ncbi:hypothetical protein GCM10023185_25720 [Hymenobacter saemangeumensis]|uniref:Porin n=1 Tax=Hymenobacter saemangeumensis TaxID=1084522 RepID=A0ABP8II11_9BACT
MKKILALALAALPLLAPAQTLKDGKLTLNTDGSRYVKLTLLNQGWARYNQSNTGTRLFGENKPHTFDLGIRRFRLQFFGQLTDRVFIYSQVGMNNFNYLSERKAGFFVHDATGDYAVVKNHLSVGLGLSGWSGLARFASPSAGTILGVDAPLVEQATNDVTDQFLRKLSFYAKGKVSRLDYRLAVASPMAIQRSAGYNATVSRVASFSARPPQPQFLGYLQWQFRDQESNLTPYTVGTYLGKKRVLNVGAGFVAQPRAMWYRADNGRDTLSQAMSQLAVDLFYDAPVDTTRGGPSVSFYATAIRFDFGPNYLRNLGVMNPAAGGTVPATILNGPGNALPLYGSGNVLYTQLGYKLRDNLLGETTLMPYASYQLARYERLTDNLHYYDLGLNWLLAGHAAKFTLSYQNRPVYQTLANGDNVVESRKSAVVLQYQVLFN